MLRCLPDDEQLVSPSRTIRQRGGEDSGWATNVSTFAGLLGATLVLAMGSIFFLGSLQPQAPF